MAHTFDSLRHGDELVWTINVMTPGRALAHDGGFGSSLRDPITSTASKQLPDGMALSSSVRHCVPGSDPNEVVAGP
jgi:hypothetical protein